MVNTANICIYGCNQAFLVKSSVKEKSASTDVFLPSPAADSPTYSNAPTADSPTYSKFSTFPPVAKTSKLERTMFTGY